jgi:hypothetical protein
MSSGWTSPVMRTDSSAAMRKVSISRRDLALAESLIGFPASMHRA